MCPAADIGYASLEGYIDAAVFVAALREAGPAADPGKALVQALAFLQVDLGGLSRWPSRRAITRARMRCFITRVEAGQACRSIG